MADHRPAPLPEATATVESRLPVDLGLTLGPLRRGPGDPTVRVLPSEVWRASLTAAGPATLRLRGGGRRIEAAAWGPGAAAALAAAPALVGADDDAAGFDPPPGRVADLHHRLPGLRIGRTGAVLEALVAAVLGQKVAVAEAWASYRSLVRIAGDPAPGPGGLLCPPSAGRLASLPLWDFHRAGVERRRAETLRRAAVLASRLEEAVSLDPAAADVRLQAVAGIGPWTSAVVRGVALGDADAVPLGDYGLPDLVCWALEGRRGGDDCRMLALLEPYRGHRGRVLRLLHATGRPPRRAPRAPLRAIAAI